MRSARSKGHLRYLLSTAALAVLAALLLLPGQVRGQNAPTITGDSSASVPENTAITEVIKTYTASDMDMDMLSWSLEGDDSGDFSISTSGELTFSAVPDFEMPADNGTNNVYNVTVKVTDDETPAMSGTLDVTITVTNVNEAGTVGIIGMEKGGQTLTATLTDPDGSVSGETWKWTSSATSGGTFTDIPMATSNTYRLKAADVTKFLKATVSYTDGEGMGKTATSDETGAIAANNNEPSFSSNTATRTLPENSGAGVNLVGGTITASDGDSDT